MKNRQNGFPREETELEKEQIVFGESISREDCKNIAQWIQEENQEHGKHMIEKDALELYKEIYMY
jgi:hydroxymethylpyrimidine pyrophosphatase-like HAD family hydrolase